MNNLKGVMLASAVASMFAASAFAGDKAPAKGDKAAAAEVKCLGVNECKGKGTCGGAGNSCAGENACKGKGVLSMSEKDCKAKGGKIVAGM